MSTEEEIDLIDKMLQDSLTIDQQGLVQDYISSGSSNYRVTSSGTNNTLTLGTANYSTHSLYTNQVRHHEPHQIMNEWSNWLQAQGHKQSIVGIQEPEPTHYNFFKKLKLIK